MDFMFFLLFLKLFFKLKWIFEMKWLKDDLNWYVVIGLTAAFSQYYKYISYAWDLCKKENNISKL